MADFFQDRHSKTFLTQEYVGEAHQLKVEGNAA